jgi:hypothetical protein
MLSIQDVGLSILGDQPKNFYILGGAEFGIKDRYLDILESKIGSRQEYTSMSDVINLFSTQHIIPLAQKLYVIRYDKEFVQHLDKELAKKVKALDIIGTVVLLYSDTKDLNKLDKWFPENTASIDPVDTKYLIKYLKSDFSNLDAKLIELVAKHSIDYSQAKNVCRCLNAIGENMKLSEPQIVSIFDLAPTYSESDVQLAIASRNFNSFIYIVDHYDGDIQNILYQILRVLLELEKCLSGKYSNSPIKKYAKNWTTPDIYYMFNHTYKAIKSLRDGYTVDVYDLLVYLGALLMFKHIPSVEVL